jgi:sulfoxide reductase catalytic subunit YedY
MLVRTRRGWEISENQVTPEALVSGRRAVMTGAAAGMLSASLAGSALADPNPRYAPGRALTPEGDATTYNNFYEFGTGKDIWRAAQRLPSDTWNVEIAGLVEKPGKMELGELLRQVGQEERIYRHRCVEAWAMTVPWTGFPLSALVKLAQPLGGAKFVAFETLADPKVMPGVRSSIFNWPYVDGVTMQEAMNDLAFMVIGMYGHDLPKQDGAPLRLALPWKYGFKSVKSIVKVTFTDVQPPCFWQSIAPSEYGFWANVNPAVDHPRWSQATERLLGTGERVPTQIWNGYGDFVASMYSGKDGEALFR